MDGIAHIHIIVTIHIAFHNRFGLFIVWITFPWIHLTVMVHILLPIQQPVSVAVVIQRICRGGGIRIRDKNKEYYFEIGSENKE